MKSLTKRHIPKLSVLLLISFALSALFTGCSFTTFDASGYVKACLDANAHGEFDAYAEITNTSAETAKQQFDQRIDTELSHLDAYHIDEERKEKFRELFIHIYDSFQYEVGEATKNDDGSYSVPVTTHKLMIFKDVVTEAETYLNDYAQKEMDAGRTPTQDDLYLVAADFMYDYISQNLSALAYAEPVNTTVKVAPSASDSRIYSLDQNEFQSLLETMVDIENANPPS